MLVVHVYNGILLSHKKECIWVSSNEVDEPTACYTDWSKSEREKQISYTGNLERLCWWAYLQGSNRDTGIENRLGNTVGEGEGGTNWEISTETHTLGICCMTWGVRPSALWQPRRVGWGGRWEGGSRGRGHMYTYGWFMLMYGRNQHNIVKQLSSN